MSPAVVLGCVWVIAAALVAMLPMRRQYAPGIALLLTAPVVIAWIGFAHGWLWTAVGLFALISMFRNPFRYILRHALGRSVELPTELRERTR